MPVIINTNRVVPAPLATLSKEFNTTIGDGVVSNLYTLTFNGTLIAYKGNPVSSGSIPDVAFSGDPVYATMTPDDDPINTDLQTDGYLTAIMEKQKALMGIFNSGQNDLNLIQITGFNSPRGISGYFNIESIEFDDQSRWTSICGYTITLTAPYLLDDPAPTGYLITDPQDSWSIAEDTTYSASPSGMTEQHKSFTVSHTASAVGQRAFDTSGNFINGLTPVQQASGYVHDVIGIGLDENSAPDSYLNIKNLIGTNFSVVNRKLSEEINQVAGSYSVNEEFLVFKSGQLAREEVNISVERDLSSFTKVNINGTINGLTTTHPTGTTVDSWTNASGYFDSMSGLIYNRVNNFAPKGVDLNTSPLNTSVGRNFTQGVITYTYGYDNRPENDITDALTEDVQIADVYPGQQISVKPIIGREQAIIQYINSRSVYKRTLTINAQMAINSATGKPYRPKDSDLEAIYDFYKPNGVYVYYSEPQETWSPKTGAYSYTIEWTYKGPGAGEGFARRI